jgi:hypothetical protein
MAIWREAFVAGILSFGLYLLPLRILDALFKRDCCPYCPKKVSNPLMDVSPEEQRKQHEECSKTIQSVLLTLIVFSFFCVVTLGQPDAAFLGGGTQVAVPFTGVYISPSAFLLIGPAVLIVLTFYLHIFVGYWLALRPSVAHPSPPLIFNLDALTPRIISWLLFYWLVPLTLVVFTWKVRPHPHAVWFFRFTTLFTGGLVVLQTLRCCDRRLKWFFCIVLSVLMIIALLSIRKPDLFSQM